MVDNQEKTKNESEPQEISALSIESVAELFKSSSEFPYFKQKPVRVKEELAKREKLKNVDLEQDIKLKKLTLKVLLWFLGIESFIIFAFALLQATGWLGFILEEWSFRLLVTVTITQIYLMLRVAVEYLFPKNK